MFLNIRNLTLFLLAAIFGPSNAHPHDDILSIMEDGFLPLPLLVSKYEYPIETYYPITEDGYSLTLYRIPYGQQCNSTTIVRKPILLQHGLLGSAYDFLITGPKRSLAYILADNCYDVWLGNNRGNSQSRFHINMTTDNPNFWKFSWHEMGHYDLPAMIDVILEVTKQPKLHYVGYSQGSTQFFVFGSERTDYLSKIESMHALSPVASLKNLSSPFVKFMALFHKITEVLANWVGLHEFLPQSEFLNFIGRQMCRNKAPRLQHLCANVLFLLCGYDEPQLNVTMLPAILGHVPAGASTRQFIHYAQSISKGTFGKFDYGRTKNLELYGTPEPPQYDLTKINIPVAIYYGPNDWLADLRDVEIVKKQLPNVIYSYLVPFSKFNHLDFIFAIDAKFLLYNRLLQVLERFR